MSETKKGLLWSTAITSAEVTAALLHYGYSTTLLFIGGVTFIFNARILTSKEGDEEDWFPF